MPRAATAAVQLPLLAPSSHGVRDERFGQHPLDIANGSNDNLDAVELSDAQPSNSESNSYSSRVNSASIDEERDAAVGDGPDDEDAPLMASSGTGHDGDAPSDPAELSKWAVASLLLQHLSSTFIDGAYNFACFLFLIEVFTDSLVPASLVGFGTKLAGLALSGSIGGLVDQHPRLWFIRRAILAQKCLQALSYGLFLGMS